MRVTIVEIRLTVSGKSDSVKVAVVSMRRYQRCFMQLGRVAMRERESESVFVLRDRIGAAEWARLRAIGGRCHW